MDTCRQNLDRTNICHTECNQRRVMTQHPVPNKHAISPLCRSHHVTVRSDIAASLLVNHVCVTYLSHSLQYILLLQTSILCDLHAFYLHQYPDPPGPSDCHPRIGRWKIWGFAHGKGSCQDSWGGRPTALVAGVLLSLRKYIIVDPLSCPVHHLSAQHKHCSHNSEPWRMCLQPRSWKTVNVSPPLTQVWMIQQPLSQR